MLCSVVSCCHPSLDSFSFFFLFFCSSLLRLLPPIKPGAVGYLDRKDTHKNTLVSLMGVSFARCYRRQSVLTFRLKIFLIKGSFPSCSVSKYDRTAVNIVGSSGSASSQMWPTFFFLMSSVLLMLRVFLSWTLSVPLLTVGEFLKVFSASPLPPYSSTLRILWSRLSRGAWLASEDAHRLPSSTNSPWTTWAGGLIRLSSVSRMLHMFGWLCCTVAQPGAAQIQKYDVSATADFVIFIIIFFFFTLMLRRLINCLHGEVTQPFISAYLYEIKKKAKPTQVFLHTSQLLA